MSLGTQKIDDAAFRELSQFIHFKSGIVLDDSKKYLIETRLGPLLQEVDVLHGTMPSSQQRSRGTQSSD